MKAEEYSVLHAEISKLKALGDVLRWNASKLQDDTVESIGGLIFNISKYLMEKLPEMSTNKDEAMGPPETYVI